MKLKFPTAQRLLPPLELSDDEREEFLTLATQLVDNTLNEYSEYNRRHQIRYRSQWKPVKKCENLTVFKETQSHRRQKRQQSIRATNGSGEHCSSSSNSSYSSSASASLSASENEWRMPKLLLAGTIVGGLDDVMYGLATFDAPSMLVNSTYIRDEVVDAEVLHEILGPTLEEPFRFLGIKWVVKDNSAVISAFTSPRDLVMLESIGVRILPSGKRVGYHLMYSLDLPGYGPLPTKSVLRGRVSSCALYRQLSNSTVDVYMPANFEPNGHPGERVAVASAANALISSWRSVLCAQNKKLAWLLTTARVKPAVWDVASTALSSCGTCGKAQGTFHKLTQCQLCDGPMCSRCRVEKKIGFCSTRKEIRRPVITLCTTCVTRTNQMSAFTIAREQVLAGRWTKLAAPDSDREIIEIEQAELMMAGLGPDLLDSKPSFDADPLIETYMDDSSDDEDIDPFVSHNPQRFSFERSATKEAKPHALELDSNICRDDMEETRVVVVRSSSRHMNVQLHPQEGPHSHHQEQLWRQMMQLQMAAEHVYQYTKRTGETHLRS
ncbi:hypothetical protein FI667_g14646, partial [Globisporangium splendens]